MDSFNKALLNDSVNQSSCQRLAQSSARRKKTVPTEGSPSKQSRIDRMQRSTIKSIQDTSDVFEADDLEKMLDGHKVFSHKKPSLSEVQLPGKEVASPNTI